MIRAKLFVCISFYAFTSSVYGQSSNNLESLIGEALSQNFEIKAYKENTVAEEKKITIEKNLDDPSIGIFRLDRGLTTEYLTVQQKIKFPTKYFIAGKSQRKFFESSKNELDRAKLQLRRQLVEVYYKLYAMQKTIQLTKVNLQLVKDFARVAESKYAARKSPQTDSMKAHFEITQLELNLLNFEQEESLLQAQIASLLGRSSDQMITLSSLNLESPKVQVDQIPDKPDALVRKLSQSSPELLAQKNRHEAMKLKSKLAKWNYAPDFNIQCQKIQ